MTSDPLAPNVSVEEVQKVVHEMIQHAIGEGKPLAEIRRRLRSIGVKWKYSQRTQGARECRRRLRQQHRCETGCGRYADWATSSFCWDCRAAAWT